MKTFLFSLAAFFSCSLICAQITFQKTYGGSNDDFSTAIQQTTDGGYIIVGETKSFGVGNNFVDVYLIKTTDSGDTLWTKTFGTAFSDYARSVQETGDGGFIIAGSKFFGTGADIHLIKTDSHGDSLWTKTFGGPSTDFGVSCKQTRNGGFIITGFTASYGAGGEDTYLVQTDSLGVIAWTKTFGGTQNDEGQSVTVTSDGGYLICGSSYSFAAVPGDRNIYIMKTDSVGTLLWSKNMGGTDDEFGSSGQETNDSGFVFTGSSRSFGTGNYESYLIRTDKNGSLIWTKTYEIAGADLIGISVYKCNDEGFVLSGTISGTSSSDGYLIKTDSSGIIQWSKTYGGASIESLGSVEQTTDGGFIMAGVSQSFGAGNRDVYVVKTDSLGVSGCHETNVSIISTTVNMPSTNPATIISSGGALSSTPAFILNHGAIITSLCGPTVNTEIPYSEEMISVVPNPLVNSGMIIFSLSKRQHISLTLYDMNGRCSSILSDRVVEAGEHTWMLNADGLESGIYFLRKETESEIINLKIIILK